MWRRRSLQTLVNTLKTGLQEKPTPIASATQQARQQWGGRPSHRSSGGFGQNNRIVVFSPPRFRDGYQRFDTSHRKGIPPRQMRVLAVIGAGGTVIWISSREEIPYSGRKHAILLDTKSELMMGEQAFEQILSQARAAGTLLPSYHPASVNVRKVGARIAAVATDGFGGGFHQHMKGLKWDFAVINSPEVNAFVVPGGKVVVYTGLLRLISREDELAAVLAHEIAHVLARHAAERITQGSVVELIRMIAYWGFGLPIPQGALVAAFFLPNSRKAETEADVIGVQLAARACYDPAAAASVFEKLERVEAKAGGDSMPKFLRTHPVSADRIARINEMLPKATMLAEGAGCGELFSRFKKRIGFGF